MNFVVSNARATYPGGELLLAEPVQAGDVLRVGGAERKFSVHVVQARGTGPCAAVIGDPHPYAGLGSIPRHVLAGEPVEVIGHYGSQEER